MRALALLLPLFVGVVFAQDDDLGSRPVLIRLEPQPKRPKFLEQMAPPRAVQAPVRTAQPSQGSHAAGLPPAPPPAPAAQQPIVPVSTEGAPGQQLAFVPLPVATPPPPPPITIPPDVQNQLIKFLGIDSFGIPGLTGDHPNGIAGAFQELHAAGIPTQTLPLEHVAGQPVKSASPDVLAQANPNFINQILQLQNEASNPGPYRSSGQVPLPDPTPGEKGLIGVFGNSIRRLFKDTGVSDALAQTIPAVFGSEKKSTLTSSAAGGGGVFGGGSAGGRSAASSLDEESFSTDEAVRRHPTANTDEAVRRAPASSAETVRREPSAAQRAISSFAAALGGGGPNTPKNAGLPRIPGLPLLPGGIPRNSQGQVDVVQLIGAVTRRVSNGTTLANILPPDQLQMLADNVTDALLPDTPENFDLSKLMGRWFEGINSPRATDQRCIVHHFGGLTKNDKTATFTALKIYREGSEFGKVKYSIGYAFRGGNKDAMLQLHTNESPDAQPFWIYKLGPEGKDPFGNPQYEYAVVSNWVKYPVTVLVRDPDTFRAKYEKSVLKWLEDQGFINGLVRAFNLLQPSRYDACQYADSTFEVFGKK